MKTYEVELRRISYITLTVEANDEDEAEALAWQEVDTTPSSDDAVWDLNSIEEKANAN
jgi:hypothetical protein